MEWLGGAVALIASNGKYVGIRPNGQLVAKSTGVNNSEMFYIKLINRPILVLKCGFGFVGKKKTTASKPEYMCNKSVYEVLKLEYHEKGIYYIKGDNDKYWNLSDSSIVANGNQPEPFVLEFVGNCKLALLAPNRKYVTGEKIGMMSASSPEVRKTCYWEF